MIKDADSLRTVQEIKEFCGCSCSCPEDTVMSNYQSADNSGTASSGCSCGCGEYPGEVNGLGCKSSTQ